MPDLTVPAIELERLADLRGRAASRLTGAAATKGATTRAADALNVLHALASSPKTASDALTLLHELQVHQVEIDLQAQELRESRAELESALRRQIEVYDHLPVGCFTIDARWVLLEMNHAGADMLGLGRDDAYGLPFDAFFCADSARRLRTAAASLDSHTWRPACLLKLCPRNGPERQVLASIGTDPAVPHHLVTLTNVGEAQEDLPGLH